MTPLWLFSWEFVQFCRTVILTHLWPMSLFYTSWKQWFSGIFRGYKMGTLVRNRLNYFRQFSLLCRFMCSFMFPPCDDNTHIKTLPCREVCQSIKETSCKDEWQIIERSREFIFKHIHFPSCDSYPSVEHQQNCSLIKFAGG